MKPVSPSQIDTYLTCPRKWALKYIGEIETPPNAYAQIGTDAHVEFEAWLLHGTAPTSEIVRSGLEYLPPPGTPGVETEQHFSFSYAGVGFHGFKDYRFFDAHRHLPVVGDHKTTGDLKWAKGRAELSTDPQALIYGVSELAEYPEATHVELRWTYHLRSGRRAKPEHHVFSREEIGSGFEERVLPPATEIVSLRGAAVESVPMDFSGCAKYGGCPFLGTHCFPTPNERLFSIMSQSYLDQLRAKMAQNGASPVAINPPEGAQVYPPPGAPPVEIVQTTVAPPGAGGYAQAVPITPPVAEPPAAPEAPKKGKGGRKKRQLAPAVAARQAEAAVQAPAPQAPPTPQADAAAPQAAPAGAAAAVATGPHQIAIVYVGCMPIRGPAALERQDGAELAMAAHEMLCAAEKVPHYKLVDFGKGPGLLAVYLERIILEFRPRAVFLARDSFAFADVAPVFEKFAEVVVRAV